MRNFIAKSATVRDNVRFYGSVYVGTNAYVGDNCIVGYPWSDKNTKRLIQQKINPRFGARTTIESGVWLHANSVVCSGSLLEQGAWFDAGSFIGERTVVGRNTWVHYGARIYNGVVVGEKCNLAGFMCNRARIGDRVTSFGILIHRLDSGYRRLHDRALDKEKSPTIEDDVFVGWNALIVGGISVGKGARIGASSIVTRDVLPGERIGAAARI